MSATTKISSHLPRGGRGQRGSVAIIVAASMTFLFALGALAVDAGFMYTRERSLQAVADAAALAGGNGLSDGTSTAKATAMATINGYTNGVAGNTVTISYPVTQQIQVTITSAQAPIFGHIFGLGSKTMTATAIATKPPNNPAIWAGGGMRLVDRPVAQRRSLHHHRRPGEQRSAHRLHRRRRHGHRQGHGQQPLPPPPPWRGPVGQPTGGMNQAPPTSDPWGYNIMSFPACTVGSLATAGTLVVPTVAGVVPPGIYCANGDIDLGVGSAIVALGVTFLATGHINIGSPSITNMTPAAGCDNLVAFSTSTDNCVSGTPAINIGNSDVTINGSIYAPDGCINMGGPDFVVNGSLVGNEVNLAGPTWTINAGGGAGGGAVTLYQ